MPYFWRVWPEPPGYCTHDDPDVCSCNRGPSWPKQFRAWAQRLAFWQMPARITMLEHQLMLLAMTVGNLTAEKERAYEAEMEDAFLEHRAQMGSEDADGVWRMNPIEQEEEAHGA